MFVVHEGSGLGGQGRSWSGLPFAHKQAQRLKLRRRARSSAQPLQATGAAAGVCVASSVAVRQTLSPNKQGPRLCDHRRVAAGGAPHAHAVCRALQHAHKLEWR